MPPILRAGCWISVCSMYVCMYTVVKTKCLMESKVSPAVTQNCVTKFQYIMCTLNAV